MPKLASILIGCLCLIDSPYDSDVTDRRSPLSPPDHSYTPTNVNAGDSRFRYDDDVIMNDDRRYDVTESRHNRSSRDGQNGNYSSPSRSTTIYNEYEEDNYMYDDGNEFNNDQYHGYGYDNNNTRYDDDRYYDEKRNSYCDDDRYNSLDRRYGVDRNTDRWYAESIVTADDVTNSRYYSDEDFQDGGGYHSDMHHRHDNYSNDTRRLNNYNNNYSSYDDDGDYAHSYEDANYYNDNQGQPRGTIRVNC